MAKAQIASKTRSKVSSKKTKMPKRKKAVRGTKPKSKKVSKSSPSKRPQSKSTPKKAKLSSRVGVGDLAPSFTLNDQNGQPVNLSNFIGKRVVLYFYPKDDTPGCTKEACSFRDHAAVFENQDTVILGVSFDGAESHQKFISKYGLNFRLLSDLEKSVAKAYGCYVQKNMYGKISWGIERSTFVIDRDGRIVAAFRRVQVDGHTEEILEALKTAASA